MSGLMTQQTCREIERDMSLGDFSRMDDLIKFVLPAVKQWLLEQGYSDEMEDILQDVYYKIYKFKATYNPKKAHFITWMFSITKQVVANRWRTYKKRAKDRENGYYHSLEKNEQKDPERFHLLHKALNNLPQRDRDLIFLYFRHRGERIPFACDPTVTAVTERKRLWEAQLRLKQEYQTLLKASA